MDRPSSPAQETRRSDFGTCSHPRNIRIRRAGLEPSPSAEPIFGDTLEGENSGAKLPVAKQLWQAGRSAYDRVGSIVVRLVLDLQKYEGNAQKAMALFITGFKFWDACLFAVGRCCTYRCLWEVVSFILRHDSCE